jgi:ubiquinone/menaquinone biosynthesis C-methylase UbiE
MKSSKEIQMASDQSGDASPGQCATRPAADRGAVYSNFRLTNYSKKHNLLIYWLMRRFMNRVRHILTRIDVLRLKGVDAGCGEGHLTSYLNRHGAVANIIGLDINFQHLVFARCHHPEISLVEADLGNLPFEDQMFDYAVCTEVLEHITDPVRAIVELRRVVRRRGHLVVSVPHEPYFHWGNRLRGKYPRTGGWTPDHVNRWRRREFIRFIERYVELHECSTWQVFPWLLFHGTFRA